MSLIKRAEVTKDAGFETGTSQIAVRGTLKLESFPSVLFVVKISTQPLPLLSSYRCISAIILIPCTPHQPRSTNAQNNNCQRHRDSKVDPELTSHVHSVVSITGAIAIN